MNRKGTGKHYISTHIFHYNTHGGGQWKGGTFIMGVLLAQRTFIMGVLLARW